MVTLPFDRIEVEKNSMSVADFLAIPLRDRVRLLLERKVVFWSERGPVETPRALAALYEYARKVGASVERG